MSIFFKGRWYSKFLVSYAFSFWINNIISALHNPYWHKGLIQELHIFREAKIIKISLNMLLFLENAEQQKSKPL